VRWLALPLLLFSCVPLPAYSVLTHEAIVDSAWDQSISPLLLQRFPNTTPDDLKKAHAHAYGGCIIQDMGYYPFGSKFFSDLVHYVRSGDFVEALILEAQDVNEYAFALGALAHYAADNNGHSLAVNRAVPIVYPKLRAEFGDTVTYAENPAAHLKTEFGFDVIQVANGSYAPNSYHDFIGFEVSKPVLERAFERTYGLKLEDIFTSLDLALGTYRHTVSVLIPEMTKAAWSAKKNEIIRATPGMTRQKFLYNLSRASYEKEWTGKYEKPGWFARLLGFVFHVIPKVGPFKAMAFRPTTPETERLFMASFNTTLDRYRALLRDVRNRALNLANQNLDVGRATSAGQYELSDKAYAKLLDKLAGQKFAAVPAPLRADIVAFYSDLSGPIATKKHRGEWRKTLQELETLKSMAPVEAARSTNE
jgi:hypothetical protein